MRDNLNITGHAGCDETQDDSLMSIEAAIAFGADIAEVDVRFNKKGTLVLAHDEEPDKEYSGHPSLEKAFDIVAGNSRIAINCDIKESETIPAILELAAKKGINRERLVLTGSVSPITLKENPDIQKNALVWINIEEVLGYFFRTGNEAVKPFQDLMTNATEEDLYTKILAPNAVSIMEAITVACLSLGVKVLNMPCLGAITALIPGMKEKGIGASVWTVNDEESIRHLFSLGAFSVTTRNTRLAVKVRKGLI